jgi:hypothetical protein
MITRFDSKQFMKDMNNIVEYSIGFLDGIQGGKKIFLQNLGQETILTLKEFIDLNAQVDPAMLYHVYEWYQTGSPQARLYDVHATVSNLGLSFKSTFKQSNTVKDGSRTPFYDKARIMEEGIPVVIRPKVSDVLAFENNNGETIFTRNPIVVENPGGTAAQGGFENVMNMFFNQYFKQSFLRTTGLDIYLKNPRVFKTNMAAGKVSGKSAGYSTGFKWIANAVVA